MKRTLRILAELLLIAAIVLVIWAVFQPSLTPDVESNEWRSNE